MGAYYSVLGTDKYKNLESHYNLSPLPVQQIVILYKKTDIPNSAQCAAIFRANRVHPNQFCYMLEMLQNTPFLNKRIVQVNQNSWGRDAHHPDECTIAVKCVNEDCLLGDETLYYPVKITRTGYYIEINAQSSDYIPIITVNCDRKIIHPWFANFLEDGNTNYPEHAVKLGDFVRSFNYTISIRPPTSNRVESQNQRQIPNPAHLPQHMINTYIEGIILLGHTCPITMEPLTLQTASMLSCGHVIDRNAMNRWFEAHSNCPVCRVKITSAGWQHSPS